MSKTVKAIHQIHGVKGFDVITPGTVFECPDDQYQHLIGEGAVEDYAAEEVAVGAAASGKPAKSGKAGKAADDNDGLE